MEFIRFAGVFVVGSFVGLCLSGLLKSEIKSLETTVETRLYAIETAIKAKI